MEFNGSNILVYLFQAYFFIVSLFCFATFFSGFAVFRELMRRNGFEKALFYKSREVCKFFGINESIFKLYLLNYFIVIVLFMIPALFLPLEILQKL